MQIREIHIDAFGIFADKHLVGLKPGLNVLYGPNEAGKTSILEFIRRMLFGFPARGKKTNLYTPAIGSGCGGRLKCQLKSGDDILISRTEGRGVTIATPLSQVDGQTELNAFLGNASLEIYQNIYAFSLDELQEFRSLQGEEIKNRIYGAGLGLGRISPGEVDKWLNEYCDELFRPRGSNQKMALAFQEIRQLEGEIREKQSTLGRYDELRRALGRKEADRAVVNNELEQMESRRRAIELRKDLFPEAVALLNAEEELRALPDDPDFPEQGRERFFAFKSALDNLDRRIEEENHVLDKLRSDRDGLVLNTALLDHERDVVYLRGSLEKIRSAIHDQVAVEQEKEDLTEKLKLEIQSIDPAWDEAKVLSFELSEAERSQIQAFYDAFEQLRQRVNRSKDKLDMHRERKAEEESQGVNIPSWLNYFARSLGGLGLLASLAGGFMQNYLALGAGLVLMGSGLALFIKTRKSREEFSKEDRVEATLLKAWEDDRKSRDRKFEEWHEWLRKKGLDVGLAPLSTREIGNKVRGIRLMISQRERLDARIGQMRETLRETAHLFETIRPALTLFVPQGDLPAHIENIGRMFDEARKEQERRSHLDALVREQERKLERLAVQRKEKVRVLSEFIRSAGTENEDEFLQKHAALERRSELKKIVEEKRAFIQSRVGLGEAYSQFLQTVREITPEDIDRQLQLVVHEMEERQRNRDKLLQWIGETSKEIQQLESGDELLALQEGLEQKRQVLRETSRRWAAGKIALVLLEKAKRKYEQTRQPEVIKSARQMFSDITQGRYQHIIKPIEQNDLLIEDAAGRRKTVVEMSRGTREQLYLAMRFGLIEEYENRSEPLPVVMDDVFVNFDDERANRVIGHLKRFAETRQVLVMTCHLRARDSYLALGAHAISI
ncbi:MAG: hypothetical protein COV67_01060 [Nitrospinae bacterium CG11_big_fil_rev_8_21_14_0_20_56_8]|nr:MAG: hypothetical protein COV67_01060 [Nitrospinae bacterium CG11_big_fil_rev_8_21_14_0_20_56_8]